MSLCASVNGVAVLELTCYLRCCRLDEVSPLIYIISSILPNVLGYEKVPAHWSIVVKNVNLSIRLSNYPSRAFHLHHFKFPNCDTNKISLILLYLEKHKNRSSKSLQKLKHLNSHLFWASKGGLISVPISSRQHPGSVDQIIRLIRASEQFTTSRFRGTLHHASAVSVKHTGVRGMWRRLTTT